MSNPRWLWLAGGLATVWVGTWTWSQAQVPAVVLPGGSKKPIAPAQGDPAKPGQPSGAADDETETSERVQLPRDRLVERKLGEARRFIEDKDWPQAVRLLQSLLDPNQTDEKDKGDVFVPDKKSRWVTARVEANRLLGMLPREGLQFYEQHFGGEAYALLKKGTAAGDPQIYADVALRFMHSDAGVEAATLLGAHHLDHGRYIMAALSFERLMDRDGVLEKLPPLTLYKAALAFERAGDSKNCERVWSALMVKLNQAGQPPLPGPLKKLAPQQLRATLAAKDTEHNLRQRADWPMYLGAPDRDGVTTGGAPFLEARFERPTWEENDTRAWIDKAVKHRPTNDDPVLCGFQPIAVGDNLIYRTYGKTMAVNLKTGDIGWKTGATEGGRGAPRGSLDNLAAERGQLDPNRQIETWIGSYLGGAPHILYDNSVLGTLSTDYQYVYVVEDLAVPPHPHHLNLGWGGRGWNNPTQLNAPLLEMMEHNTLVAYDLKTGYTMWQIPDPTKRGDDPFANTFFLGPPLPLGGKLYVLAEVAADIKLMCFAPPKRRPTIKVDGLVTMQGADPGELVWTQTLCTLTERRLPQDPTRRTQAVHLAYGDGILVCPTNTGIVVGVDLLTRSLTWAHVYQNPDRSDNGMSHAGVLGIPGQIPGRFPGRFAVPQTPIIPPAWSASAPIIRDGMAVFTAPDGDSVRCLNLRDGTKVWEIPREVKEPEHDLYLYLAGVYQGKVLLVGKKNIYAVGLADGKSLWRTPIGLPSGRGAANGQSYFLPLQSGDVWTVEIATGAVQGKSRAVKKDVPGNLVFHNGDVVSQTPLSIAVYTQLEVKEREISNRLGQNPNDPKGLAERGELRLHRGDLVSAADDFRAALTHQPPDVVRRKARAKLYDALAELLEQNFAPNEKLLPEFQELTVLPAATAENKDEKEAREQEERDRRARYLSLLARGREGQSRFRDALDAYLDFAALDQGKMIGMPSGHLVVPHKWAHGRIRDLLQKANPEQRKALEQVFQDRWRQTEQNGGLETLQQFVENFGGLCSEGRLAKLRLAQRLAEVGDTRQAELLLRQIIEDQKSGQVEPTVAAQACELLGRVCLQVGALEMAGDYYRKLGQEYAKVPVRDGKTGLEIFQEAATDKRLLPYLDKPGSPLLGLGQRPFEYELKQDRFIPGSTVFWLEPQGDVPALARRFRIGVDPGAGGESKTAKVVIVDQFSGKETAIGISTPSVQGSSLNPQKYRPPCFILGQLAIFAWVNRVYALDLLHLENAKPVWEYSLLGALDTGSSRASNEAINLRLDENGILELVYQNGYYEKVGTLNLADPECVCFVAKDKGLVAVDPLSGKERWIRPDVSSATVIFGDNRHLYLMTPGGPDGGIARSTAVRVLDGASVAIPDFAPIFQHKVRLIGRNLLVRENDPQGGMKLRLYDVHTGQDIWSRKFSPQVVLMNSLDPTIIGVIDPGGKVEVLNALNGEGLFHASVDAGALAGNPELHVLRDDRWVYIAFNEPNIVNPRNMVQRQTMSGPFSSALRTLVVNGPFYAIDPADGHIAWQRPIPPQAIIVNQFEEVPLLLCASMQTQWSRNNAGQVVGQTYLYNVLALDKRDGSVVYEHEKQGNTTNSPFYSMKVDSRLATVELTSQSTKLIFRQANEQAQR